MDTSLLLHEPHRTHSVQLPGERPGEKNREMGFNPFLLCEMGLEIILWNHVRLC